MKRMLLLSANLLVVSATASHAAITITLPTLTTVGSVVIDAPIAFLITKAGSVQGIVFDEWVTSDGTKSTLVFAKDTIAYYNINGGSTQQLTFDIINRFALVDNLAGIAKSISANDGFIEIPVSSAVVIGNIFTLLPSTLVLPAQTVSNFNPAAAQIVTEKVFLAGQSGEALSGLTSAVPEPSAALLSLLGAGLLVRRRRIA